jgi:hypothetical protein
MRETIYVSAFILNANSRNDRTINDYINYGKKLLYAPVKKIIFFDETIIDRIPKDCIDENIQIIPVKKSDNYLYQYTEKIKNFSLNTSSPSKDTIDYVFLMCNKTEYIRKAIEITKGHSLTNQFIWIDFGINHIFDKTPEHSFENALISMSHSRSSLVRIPSLWTAERYEQLRNHYKYDIYKDIVWIFAGGIFGGDSESLIRFADLTKKKCIQTIEEKGTLMWETNIWALVYLENQELFSTYHCNDHDSTMLTYYSIR